MNLNSVRNALTSAPEPNAVQKWEQDQRLRLAKRYLDLMEDCLTGSIYEDPPLKILNSTDGFNLQNREYGWDWPSKAHTMIGRKRLSNFRQLIEISLMNGTAGDIVETGVWRGGACILARAVLDAYSDNERNIWLADSFEGLPPPKESLYPADAGDQFHSYSELAVSLETVKKNFEKYGLLDERVKFIVGWFDQTLPTSKISKISVLRLDGDMYESTIVALDNLYSKVSVGGFVIIDDYHVVAGCKKAVNDFAKNNRFEPQLIEIDGVGVYWQKST
jgi:O-methyltransferase